MHQNQNPHMHPATAQAMAQQRSRGRTVAGNSGMPTQPPQQMVMPPPQMAPAFIPPNATQEDLMRIISEQNKLRSQQDQRLADLYRLFLEQMQRPGAESAAPGWAWPKQQLAGQIEYPDLLVYPFMWGFVELTESGVAGGASYGTSGAECSAQIQTSDIFSYIQGTAFRLRRLTAPEEAAFLPLDAWLPFGCKYHPFIADGDQYVGKDFVWEQASDADGIQWQGLGSRDRSSNDLNVDGVFWYESEYRVKARDIFTISATPLGATRDGETFVLETALIGYEMREEAR